MSASSHYPRPDAWDAGGAEAQSPSAMQKMMMPRHSASSHRQRALHASGRFEKEISGRRLHHSCCLPLWKAITESSGPEILSAKSAPTQCVTTNDTLEEEADSQGQARPTLTPSQQLRLDYPMIPFPMSCSIVDRRQQDFAVLSLHHRTLTPPSGDMSSRHTRWTVGSQTRWTIGATR